MPHRRSEHSELSGGRRRIHGGVGAAADVQLFAARGRGRDDLPHVLVHLAVDALVVEERARQLLLDEEAQRWLTVVADRPSPVVGLVARGIVLLHVEEQGLLGVHLAEAGLHLLADDVIGLCVALQGAVDLVELVKGVLRGEALLEDVAHLAAWYTIHLLLARHFVDLLDALDRVFLLRLQALIDLLEDLVLDLVVEAVLAGGLRDGAGWQVQVDLVNDLGQVALHEGDNDGLGELLAVGLASAIMLRLDMKIERAVAAIQLPAISVRAGILLVDHIGWPSVMLFPILLVEAVAAAIER